MKKPRKISKVAVNGMQFKSLSRTYGEMTIEEIEEAEVKVDEEARKLMKIPYGGAVATILTGFSTEKCILCESASYTCADCFWRVKTREGCAYSKTFRDIHYAKDSQELKKAMDARSEYMETLL